MSKKRLMKIEEKVLSILEKDEKARDDDRRLTVMVHAAFYGIDPKSPYYLVMMDDSIPTQETIGRCRRKIQEKNFGLRGSKAKEKIRMEEQEGYIEYARGDI